MSDRILLVDDEQEFLDVLSQRMETRGLDVDVATDGPQAVEKTKDKNYTAVILDLMMPGMDGIETCKRLLEQNPDLQIVLLSGHGTLEKGVEAVKVGAMDFLEKPADFSKLMKCIEQAKANKMLLVEKKNEERLKTILQTKYW